MGEAVGARVEIATSLATVEAAAWNALANPEPATYNPFVDHAFLTALETSGSVGNRSGWIPRHLLIREDGRLVGAMPAYAKLHSQGEYVFDHGWADAYHRAGGQYYPKLQIAVPFTPVPGPRLLTVPGPAGDAPRALLAEGAAQFCRQAGMSGAHVTFCSEADWNALATHGYLKRTDQQFHWSNEGYETFDDFLAALASRKRKTVRKEREQALAAGLEIVWLSGSEIEEAHWDAFFEFYMDTGSRKWGRPYLNRRFFSELGSSMAERCLLIMAKRDGRWIAGALNLIGGDCLYGRYWGAVEHHPCLHFEVCYYQAIAYAIRHKLARVEAGAQGEHKLARGYMPTATYSAHWIADPALRRAIARYLEEERRHVAEQRDMLAEFAPYRKAPAPEDA